MAPLPRDTLISKAMSKLLRHTAMKEGLPIDSQGFVPVSELLKHSRLRSLKATIEDIERVVQNDNKQRYTMEKKGDGGLVIRANQGHSLKTVEDLELKKIDLDHFKEPIIHGTSLKNWDLIKASGYLDRMNRNHIHFAVDVPQNRNNRVISGMRSNTQVFIYIDKDKAKKNGIEFVQSSNGVVLSSGIEGKISLDNFEKVVDRNGTSLMITLS